MRSQENPYFSRKKIICLIINFSPPKSWGSDSYWTIYYIVASLPKTTELGRSALILPELLTLSTSVLWTIQVTLVLLAAHAPHCHFFPMIKQRSWTCTRSQRRPLETVLPLKSRGTFFFGLASFTPHIKLVIYPCGCKHQYVIIFIIEHHFIV